MKVRCNKCSYIGEESEFPKGRDLFQKAYIAACPECDNRQSPGGASLRMMPGEKHPFVYVRETVPDGADAYSKVMHDAREAS